MKWLRCAKPPTQTAEARIDRSYVEIEQVIFHNRRDVLELDLHIKVVGNYIIDAPTDAIDDWLRDCFDRRRAEIMANIVEPTKDRHGARR